MNKSGRYWAGRASPGKMGHKTSFQCTWAWSWPPAISQSKQPKRTRARARFPAPAHNRTRSSSAASGDRANVPCRRRHGRPLAPCGKHPSSTPSSPHPERLSTHPPLGTSSAPSPTASRRRSISATRSACSTDCRCTPHFSSTPPCAPASARRPAQTIRSSSSAVCAAGASARTLSRSTSSSGAAP